MKRYALVVALLLLAACEQKDDSRSHPPPLFGGPFRAVDVPANEQKLGIADPRNRGWKPSRSPSTKNGSDFVVGESYVYLGNGIFRCQKVIDVNELPE